MRNTRHLLWLMVLAGLLGCERSERLVTEYGKVAGQQGGTSVNGTGILLGMFRDRGHRVKRLSKISPRLKKYDTVIWFPDNDECPSEEAVTALEDWLREGDHRTLIYVGRDFDAELDYLERIAASSSVENSEEIWRQLAEVKLSQDQRRHRYLTRESVNDCRWFELQPHARHKVKRLTGPLVEGIEVDSTNIELATVLRPPAELLEDDWITVAPLLSTDDVDFVYSISETRDPNEAMDFLGSTTESKVIVVNNGSFLLNYGLVNHDNRQLASALIDQVDMISDVVFLESGPWGIQVTEEDSSNRNAWAWIAEPPLRYIVPHFLLWGLLFCFVFLPIFGRTRRLQRNSKTPKADDPNASTQTQFDSTTSFRSHIVAMGKLLQRTGQPAVAAEKIRQYQTLHGKDVSLK